MKNTRVASLSILSQSFRILSGPLTIFIIAKTLSVSEMSIYYAFFNVIALQQIMEMGVGFTIRQYISHAYKIDKDKKWLNSSKEKIISYMRFSFVWYMVISMFVLLIVGFAGEYFFSSYEGTSNWMQPWWTLVIFISVFTIFTPIQFLVEGCQQQLSLYKARLISGVLSSVSLCISLYYGAGLYSIVVSIIVLNIVLYIFIYNQSKRLVSEIINIKPNQGLFLTFIDVWPMLSKISVTWILGYFFWNSFNLIAFKTLSNDQAGRFGFTLSLAKAGYSIAESLIASQTTIYSNYISNGLIDKARKQFERLMLLSMAILFIGFSSYIILYLSLPDLFIFKKTLGLDLTLSIFVYFILLLPITSHASYCRCFKVEPYFRLSLFINIQVPIVFFIICFYQKEPNFIYLLPFSMLSLIWSCIIYRKAIGINNTNEI